MNIRNQALYVDLGVNQLGQPVFFSPDNFPRYVTFHFLTALTKVIDAMTSYFELTRLYLEEEKYVTELVQAQLTSLKELDWNTMIPKTTI